MKDEMVCLEPFDWRYSAAIVGLQKYLEWLGTEEPELIITEDTLEYNRKYLNKSEFLKFAEYYFKDDMHHIEIENKLKEKNPTEDQINIVNEKMKANTILKNKFKKIKFDGHNQDEIQNIIDQNREEIISDIPLQDCLLYGQHMKRISSQQLQAAPVLYGLNNGMNMCYIIK